MIKFFLFIFILKILLADAAREIFQIFLVQKSQKQGSEFLDLVYKFKQNYSQALDFRPVTDQLDNSIYDSMVALCTKMEPPDKRIRAIITDADQDTLNGILMVSSYLHIPVIDIRRHFYANDPVLTQYYLSIYPSLTGADKLLSSLFTRYGLYTIALVLDAKHSSSFFFQQKLKKTLEESPVQLSHVAHYSQGMGAAERSELLMAVNDYTVHAILLFMRPELAADFFRLLASDQVDVTKFVWVIAEIGYSVDPLILASYPTGTLVYKAIESLNGTQILSDVTSAIIQTANSLAGLEKTPASLLDTINSITCLRNISGHHYHLQQGTLLYQHLKLKGLQFEVDKSKYQLDFGADGFVSNAAYVLLNLIETESNLGDGASSSPRRQWRIQGRFVRETLKLDTIIWPGGSPRLPHSFRSVDTHKIRLVLKESLPFVMVTEQFSKTPADEEKCMDVGLICLNVTTSDPRTIQKMLNGQLYARRLCCFGFTVDLAKRIAKDLGLSYVAFLTSEAMVGSKINGTWRGMVGDIAKGSADMAAGATSITPERMEVVDFTVPYYSSAFGTLSARKPPSPNLGAFLDPFSFPMWVLIFIFVHITAIFMAMFEWLSPYGLHPLGRNRAKTFSFPSGLLHTWSLLFSHTYNSKPPKSVASRVIVNAWGMFAVVFIAGYTANLASFMAGRMLDPNIDISKLRYPHGNLRFATIIGTSTEYYLKLYFPHRYKEFKQNNVLSLDEGVRKLKMYDLEAVMFDAPMVEYKAATDPECTLIAAGSNFWSDTYGLAFPQGSSLTAKISSLIVKYEATGVLSTWEKKWLSGKAECHSPSMSRYRLSVFHARGVFMLIAMGVLAALGVLIFEWIVYKFLVPILRKHRREGRWRYIMFISQRLNSALQNAPRSSKSFEKLHLSDIAALSQQQHHSNANSINKRSHSARSLLSLDQDELNHFKLHHHPSQTYPSSTKPLLPPELAHKRMLSSDMPSGAQDFLLTTTQESPPLLLGAEVSDSFYGGQRSINRMVGGGSDGNYQPIVPIANRLSRENSLKRQQQQNKASPITVSPVHTVKDDLKYTNYTCKPVNTRVPSNAVVVSNQKGSSISVNKPAITLLSHGSNVGGHTSANVSPDSQTSSEVNTMPASSTISLTTPLGMTANGNVRTGISTSINPASLKSRPPQMPRSSGATTENFLISTAPNFYTVTSPNPQQRSAASHKQVNPVRSNLIPGHFLRTQLSDEDSSRDASSSGAEINL